MKVFVQGKDMEITRAMREFAQQKTQRHIGKLGQRVLAVRVYLENIERKKTDPAAAKAKVKLEIPGKDIVVKEAAHDLYAAMTEAFKSAQRQLRKLKDKRLQRQR